MAIKDFKAKRIRAATLIATGTGPGLLVYSSTNASNFTGGVADSKMLTNVGTDVFMFVSGVSSYRASAGAWVGTRSNITLFGGDVVVSGTLWAERTVIEVDGDVTGSLLVSGTLLVSQSAEIREGLVVNSSREYLHSEDRFIVYGSSSADRSLTGIRYNPNTHQVLFLSGGMADSPNEAAGSDVAFYVSGTRGSHGTAVRGTAIFGGDLVVSGTTYFSSATGIIPLTASMVCIGWDPNDTSISNGPVLRLASHEGTIVDGNILGTFDFAGIDAGAGSGAAVGAQIIGTSKGTWANNDNPTELTFKTVKDGTSTLQQHFVITHDGRIGRSDGSLADSNVAELQVEGLIAGAVIKDSTVMVVHGHAGDTSGSVAFKKDTSGTAAALVLDADGGFVLVNSGSDEDIVFKVRQSSNIRQIGALSGSNRSVVWGYKNTITDTTPADSKDSIIAGGYNNVIYDSEKAAIGGGYSHVISASNYGVIAGGNNHELGTARRGAILGGSGHDLTDASYGVIVGGSGHDLEGIPGVDKGPNYSFIGGGLTNKIQGSGLYGIIVGGQSNTITSSQTNESQYSVLVGGLQQDIEDSDRVFMGGGFSSIVSSSTTAVIVGGGAHTLLNSDYGVIIGGYDHNINSSEYAFIGGGRYHIIGDGPTAAGGGANYSAIAGGHSNVISGSTRYSFIGGGYQNSISASAGYYYSAIAGGTVNHVVDSSTVFIGAGGNNGTLTTTRSGIVSGYRNQITGSTYVTIGGGWSNTIDDSTRSFIGGGYRVQMSSSDYSFMGGGGGTYGNEMHLSDYTVLVGGRSNVVTSSDQATIVGGYGNKIYGAQYASILGGWGNQITASQASESESSTIAGGQSNKIYDSAYSAIGAGRTLEISSSDYATIVGGRNNYIQLAAGADYSAVLGGSGSTVSAGAAFALGMGLTVPTADTVAIGGGDVNTPFTIAVSGSNFALRNDRVFFLSGTSGDATANDFHYDDISFFVSGAAGSKGTSTRAAALFGGDLGVSGTLSLDNNVAANSSLRILGPDNATGNVIDIDVGKASAGNLGLTTGKVISIEMGNDVTTGQALYINEAGLGFGPRNIVEINTQGAGANGKTTSLMIRHRNSAVEPALHVYNEMTSSFTYAGQYGNPVGAKIVCAGAATDPYEIEAAGLNVFGAVIEASMDAMYVYSQVVGLSVSSSIDITATDGFAGAPLLIATGAAIYVTGATTYQTSSLVGVEIVVTGAVTNTGLTIKCDTGGTFDDGALGGGYALKVFSVEDSQDFFAINTVAGGNTTIETVDGDGSSASLTIAPDGQLYLSSNGVVMILSGAVSSPASPDESTHTDINFFVSGSAGSKGGAVKGTALFGGDLVVSGNVYLAMSGTNNIASTLADAGPDVNFFVSGTAGSKDSAIAGTALFGGDLVVSGVLYAVAGARAPAGLSGSYIETGELRTPTGDLLIDVAGDIVLDADGGNITFKDGGSTRVKILDGGSLQALEGLQVTGSSGQRMLQATKASAPIVFGSLVGDGGIGPMFIIHPDDADHNCDIVLAPAQISGQGKLFLGMGAQSPNAYVAMMSGDGIYESHIRGATAQVLVMSGGAPASADEATFADTNFFVSGTIGAKDGAVRGTALFGGDLVTSGTLFVADTIYGSIHHTAGGLSYLVAGDNVTVTSASNGQVTIASTGGGGGGGNIGWATGSAGFQVGGGLGPAGWISTSGSLAVTGSIVGGTSTVVSSDTAYAAIIGGQTNTIITNSDHSLIGGGLNNTIDDSQYAFIGGGRLHYLGDSSDFAVVGGGSDNDINNSQYAFIGGGSSHNIDDSSHRAFIGGGHDGLIQTSQYATIAGGHTNSITTAGNYSAILGGSGSLVTAQGSFAIGTGLEVPVANTIAIGGGTGHAYTTVVSGTLLATDTVSGSIHHTAGGLSYLVAGDNVTVTSASNGQVTIASSGDGGTLRKHIFLMYASINGAPDDGYYIPWVGYEETQSIGAGSVYAMKNSMIAPYDGTFTSVTVLSNGYDPVPGSTVIGLHKNNNTTAYATQTVNMLAFNVAYTGTFSASSAFSKGDALHLNLNATLSIEDVAVTVVIEFDEST